MHASVSGGNYEEKKLKRTKIEKTTEKILVLLNIIWLTNRQIRYYNNSLPATEGDIHLKGFIWLIIYRCDR